MERQDFLETVAALYAELMQTTREHIAITFGHTGRENLWLGRQTAGELLFLDAEIRVGRTQEQRRAFALAVMEEALSRWNVPKPNMKIVFTEHKGELMMGYNRIGQSWSPDESN